MSKVIVFVDDSKTVLLTAQMAVKSLIEKGDIKLKSYENPLKLLEDVKKGFSYDLLITDVNMPQMNGLDMAKELKSNPNLKNKPILALTTENAPEKRQKQKRLDLLGGLQSRFHQINF